ncbi:DUF871 domain-containing protein [Desemzia sp. RIT804]|uniref:DUF871 domain-containing protein n=1 Tax=Desemzia sp. RIT 804 TaxID=2810209 RepID=UPI00195243C3|nr:MupG family TIM beta-alpha barrel fold protein [Desemzia sp. RIT 804]MBM6615915.1 DUF871 domain-containing protein [Desemzia sp. RIT 804]
MFGLSIFLGDELTDDKKNYLKQMKEAGFTKVFTSLHIPEEDTELYLDRLNQLGSILRELKLELVADISKGALDKIGISFLSADSLRKLKEIGVNGLRVDYGFSNEEIAFMSNELNIVLNASTITEKDVSELNQYGASFPHMVAMHNYYPRPETGLAKEVFQDKNVWLNEIGVAVAAFVPGDKQLRGPLYQQLPSLEDHRGSHPLAAAIELLTDCFVDEVYIGDPEITNTTIYQFKRYITDGNIVFYVSPVKRSPYFETVLGIHQNRWDPAKDVLRSADARFKEIPDILPYETSERIRGSVTIDNQKYQRYMGEIQVIVHTLPKDEKVNVVAQIREEDHPLLDWCGAGCQFELKEQMKQKEENTSELR